MTSLYAVEGQMRMDVGTSRNFAEDIRGFEFAVIDPSPRDHDDVTVISDKRLIAAVKSAPIHDAKLPFDVKVERWYDNSEILGPAQVAANVDAAWPTPVSRKL